VTQRVAIDLPDLEAMEAFGARIAAALRPGDVVALSGGLGAGKTTLARSVIAALGHTGEVPSPTFTIVETYDPPSVRLPLDEYRDGAALLAEWPDKAGGFAHEPDCLSIHFEIAGSGRRAIVEPGEYWLGRVP
jgi:tRNA threonylcarbamoyladenosine biosynthesis protein TsaE